MQRIVDVRVSFSTNLVEGKQPELAFGTMYNSWQKGCTIPSESFAWAGEIDFAPDQQFVITHYNHDWRDNLNGDPTSVEITRLELDGIDMHDFIYTNGTMYPWYNPDNIQCWTDPPPLELKPGTVFNHNGKWVFPVQFPLWRWYAEEIEK